MRRTAVPNRDGRFPGRGHPEGFRRPGGYDTAKRPAYCGQGVCFNFLGVFPETAAH